MGSLDLVLLIVFGCSIVVGLAGGVYSFRRALKVANNKDGDLKMFLWAAVTMACLIVAGLSAAYFVLPLIISTIAHR
ncbi:MAG TPA: hypothetical protein VGB89_12895 [Bacteroidota bacterium]|jgi:hypothetical protein